MDIDEYSLETERDVVTRVLEERAIAGNEDNPDQAPTSHEKVKPFQK
jgi:hypothetical protein